MAVVQYANYSSIPLTYVALALIASYALYNAVQIFKFLLRGFTPLRKLPGPPSASFFTGNLPAIFKAEAGVLHDAWAKEYGITFVYHAFLGSYRLCTLDPRALGYIMSNNYLYPKPTQAQRNLARILGEGVLVAEGDVHKRQRRIMNPSFSPQQIRAVTPIFFDKAIELRDIWKKDVEKASSADGVIIDVCKWMSRATLDIIGLAGFDYTFNSLTDEGNEMAAAFNGVFKASTSPSVFAILRAFIPFFSYVPTQGNLAINRSMATMRRIGLDLVRRKKETVKQTMDGAVDKSTVVGRDLLTALVRANMATDVTPAHKLSDEEVLAQISTFLLAGHETTSTALTWTLYALSRNEAVQAKLRNELLAVEEDTPSMDDLNALAYLDMVVREVMRLYSPVPNTIRTAAKDDIIPLSTPFVDRDGVTRNSISIKKDDGVFLPIKSINVSEHFWGPDSREFRPERWEKIPIEATAIPGIWAHTMSFIGGPRACIGYRFSIIEMKAILFTLIRAYTYQLAEPNAVVIGKSAIVTRPYIKGREAEGAQMRLIVKAVGRT